MVDGGEAGAVVLRKARWRVWWSLDCKSGLLARCLTDQPRVVAVVSWP